MNLLKEFKSEGYNTIGDSTAQVLFKVFEGNSGAIELANLPKMRPRTKHINLVYHHFLSRVTTRTSSSGDVTVTHRHKRPNR